MHKYSILLLICIFIFRSAAAGEVTLFSSHTIGKIGTEVILDVRVKGFSDIIACQASVNWDPSLMQFEQVSDFGINYLTSADFGTTNASLGHVRFLWEPDDALPITVADSTILFRIHFQVLGGAGETANIGFIDSQFNFPIEIANSAFELLPYTTMPGTAALYQNPEDVVHIQPSPDSSCDSKHPTGSMKVSVNGDTTNFRFLWYIGSVPDNTPDFIGHHLTGLPKGFYSLEVADKNYAILVPGMISEIIQNPTSFPDIVEIISNVPQTNCQRANGKLEITVNGNQPLNTYAISWWDGVQEDNSEITSLRNMYIADPLNAGNYEIIVENPATGCVGYLKTAIVEQLPIFNVAYAATPNQFCKDSVNGSASIILSEPEPSDLLFFWFNENDPIDTTKAIAKTKTVQTLDAGTYKALVVQLASECVISGYTTVINAPHYTPATITQNGDTLIASYPQSNWLYNGTSTNQVGPYILPEKNGNYTITFYNEFNCYCTSDDFPYHTTGLTESSHKIIIYPNPFTQRIRISNPDGIITLLQIVDTKGRLCFEKQNIKDQFTDISLTGSDNGIYFLKILKDNVIETKKLIRALAQ